MEVCEHQVLWWALLLTALILQVVYSEGWLTGVVNLREG
jgi:hypothetical protein